MPGSLLEPLRSRRANQGLVNRANSAHSDRSDASAYSSEGGSSKKVSFNKAVRVKKYSNPPQRNTIDLEDSKFWFKIHKINNHQHHLTPESKLEELQPFCYVQSVSNNCLDKDHHEEDTSDIVNRLSTIAESDSSFKSTPSMPRKEPIVINYNSEASKPSETKRRFINYTPYRSKSSEYNGEETLRNRSPSPLRSFEYETKVRKVPKDTTWEYHESQIHHEQQKRRTPSPFKHEDSKQQEKKKPQEATETVQVIEKKSPFLSGFKIKFGATAKAAPIFPLTKPKPEKKEIDYSVNESANLKNGSRSPFKFRTLDENHNYQEDSKLVESNNKISDKAKYRSRRDQSPIDRQVAVKENVPKTFDNDIFVKSRLSPKEPWQNGTPKASDTYSNKQSDTSLTRREGRSFMNREEGSQLWKHDTHQKYEDVLQVPKSTSKERQMNEKNRLRTRSPSPRKEMIKSLEYSRAKDDKLYTPPKSEVQEEVIVKKQASLLGNESDFFPYLDSYLPKMEDKACQCNLKKSSKQSSSEPASNFRVIKSGKDGSVSTFSDVPQLLPDDQMQEKTPVVRSDVIYSQIDKTKKRTNNDTNYDDQDENNNMKEMGDYLYAKNPTKERLSQSPVRLERTPSPLKQLEKQAEQFQQQQMSASKGHKTITTVTKGRTFNFEPGVDAPVVKMPLKPSISKWYPKSSRPSGDNWYQETTQITEQIFPRSRRESSKREAKRETIEETMSISNVSSDEMMPHINTDNEDNFAPKSVIREIDHQKGEIFYENVAPRKASPKGPYDEEVTNGSALWFKSLDEDYRKGMSEREVTSLSINQPVNYPSSTLSKAEIGRRHSRRDYSPVGPRHAYTLDRRHLEDRKKIKRLLPSQSQMPSLKNVEMYDTRADRFGHSNMRRFSSNRDLASEMYEPKRGGLAAAYKARQKRASSMDRYGGGSLERYHSALMLNGYGGETLHRSNISRHPSSEIEIPVHHTRSTQKVHKNEPVVLYIPAISHHERKVDHDDRSSGINLARTQSMLSSTKRTSKKDKKELKEITSKLNGYVKPKSPSGLEEEDEIVELRDEDKSPKKDKEAKKKLIKRSQSMPKDTKLPWLSRFRFKVKSKESR